MSASGELQRFGTLHFATHADADGRQPLTSALVLAPDPLDPRSDGRLLAGTIAADWHLQADLVNLASCRSLAGRSTTTDGAMGLPQAFLAAGARSVIASAWPADDIATAQLMQRFYAAQARGLDRAESLRQAKCWLRDYVAADGTRPYAHPCYWSGFLLLGDPH